MSSPGLPMSSPGLPLSCSGAAPDPEQVLARFGAPTREWFTAAFPGPTPAQTGAWEAISRGRDTLVVAPTGSGKTLAAFLWGLDQISRQPVPGPGAPRCRLVYVSPLRALATDVERNLRAPLVGIEHATVRAGRQPRPVLVAMRTSDSAARDRRAFARAGADILITTPESLYLVLTSQARERLAGVQAVIVDEIHALAGTKRGAHLAVSLERLDALLPRRAQRIGLSATVRPAQTVAGFLAGTPGPGHRPPVVVQPDTAKEWDLQIQVPVPDLADLAAGAPGEGAESPSIWPHVEARIVDLVAPTPQQPGRSSLVFVNSRRLAERLTARLNEEWQERVSPAGDGRAAAPSPGGRPPAELAGQSGIAAGAPAVVARAHHASVSKEQRALIEDDLKSGRLPAVVATSSLELGIDMGAIDLVVQVASPPSVAGGLQRVGRAGHQVGAVSRGVIFPRHRADLLVSTVVTQRMKAGRIESLRTPANPLDVLAQQVVAMVAMDDWQVGDLHDLLRRSATFASLTRPVLESVLDMLSGRYPAEAFAELRPRLVWDRVLDRLTARPGAQRLAVTSGGTIADRGLFGVFLASRETAARRVGELDEEMVYESRVGDIITLGTSSWRIVEITHDQVLVLPAPGAPGRLPFWHGDQPSRPAELGAAIGAFIRRIQGSGTGLDGAGLDDWARDALTAYLTEQQSATGRVPDDRTLVLERFRDELGDWRIVLHSPYGAGVHAPWALVIGARLRAATGVDAQVMAADDGIVLRLPDTGDPLAEDEGGPGPAVLEAVLADPATITAEVTEALGGSALFASRFRECAGRALLLPRRRPDRRTPLWQQRQRAAQLLAVAAGFPSFPIVLETVRECLQDVYDVPALTRLLQELASGAVQVVEVSTPSPSPMARSLLFGYVAQFLYEGDSPVAERRAAALALDPDLLADLLGDQGGRLADLLDPQALLRTEADLQRVAADRLARSAEEVADLLRLLGPLPETEVARRCTAPQEAPAWVADLVAARRAIRVRVADGEVVAAVEDAARLRDGLGVALPPGLPAAHTDPVPTPLEDLLVRHARTHLPFTAAQAAARWGLGVAVAEHCLGTLARSGRLTVGDFLPDALRGRVIPVEDSARQFCHPDVLRLLRRRSLAALRAEVEPVPGPDLARFQAAWQQVPGRLHGTGGVLAAVEQLAGARVPASALESLILPARVTDYRPGMLDELTTAGEVMWTGAGRLGGDDGWVVLHPAETVSLTLPLLEQDPPSSPVHQRLRDLLSGGGGWFFPDLLTRIRAEGDAPPEQEVADALWDLVWAGQITSDTLAPLRARVGRGRSRAAPTTSRSRYRRPTSRLAARVAAARAGDAAGAGALSGRWSRVPEAEPDPTVRAVVAVEVLLDRYGVVTRGSVLAEQLAGGFAAAYRVLASLEESGSVRRGYFVEGLGASQFASTAAVDRLRSQATDPVDGSRPGPPGPFTRGGPAGGESEHCLVLAACDPANPYGAALPWPEMAGSHRPGRRAGALVASLQGRLVAYLERGAQTVLTFTGDPAELTGLAHGLADLVRAGRLTSLTVRTVDGVPLLGSGHLLVTALTDAGFHPTPRGLRLRR